MLRNMGWPLMLHVCPGLRHDTSLVTQGLGLYRSFATDREAQDLFRSPTAHRYMYLISHLTQKAGRIVNLTLSHA